MPRRRKNQREKIQSFLERGGKLTSMQAFKKFNATRLSGVIFELKKRYKMDIKTNMIVNKDTGKMYAQYYLA